MTDKNIAPHINALHSIAEFGIPGGGMAIAVIPMGFPSGEVGLAPQAFGAMGDVLPVVSKTRPANTTAYTIGDIVGDAAGTVWQFDGMARANGGRGALVDIILVSNANQATLPAFDLMLFDTTFTIVADNSPFTVNDNEMLTFVGGVGFGAPFIGAIAAGASGNVAFHSRNLYFEYKCAPNSRSLFGALVARNAYTPVSAEVFSIRPKVRWLD